MINEVKQYINIIDKNVISTNLDKENIKFEEKQLEEEIKLLWNN